MKTIVFVSCQKSGSSREAIKQAEKLGYYTVLLTNKEKQLEQRSEFPEVCEMIFCDLFDIEVLKKKISELQSRSFDIKAIISFIDPHCYTASALAEEFGVNRFTSDAILKMQDKILSRMALKDTEYTPRFRVLNNGEPFMIFDIKRLIPFMMKNPHSTGSKDVFLIRNFQEFIDIMNVLIKRKQNDKIIIEEYLDGPQVLVETMVINNEVKIIAIVEQELYFYNGHFIVTGYKLMVESSEEYLSGLKKAVTNIIKCHGMENGTCHLEMRNINDRWKLVEINPRVSGGAMNDLVEYALGINIVKETIKLALGEEVDLEPKKKIPTYVEYIIMNNSGKLLKITGKKKAKAMPGVKKIYIKPRKGAIIYPPVSMGNRYAYVIAIGNTIEEAQENAKNAAKEIKFHLLEIGS